MSAATAYPDQPAYATAPAQLPALFQQLVVDLADPTITYLLGSHCYKRTNHPRLRHFPAATGRGSTYFRTRHSVGVLKTTPGIGVYSGTKFAVRAIMETLREEVAQTIKVTTIFPGATQSELGHDITSPRIKTAFGNLQAMPKMDEHAIVNAVIYAISQPGNINVNDIVLRPLGQTR